MNRRRAVVLAAVLAAIALGAIFWIRSRSLTPSAQLKRLPAAGAVVAYVDFDLLRRGGILDALNTTKVVEDDEYRKFAQAVHLDWRRDLDSAMVAFAPSGKYMLVKGRFDWKSLDAYASQSGGDCEEGVCRMNGSAPDRRISFFPMQRNLMALAVSTDDLAAKRMIGETPGPDPAIPDAPVWLRIPGAMLKSGEGLPDGTRMFARTVGSADYITLMFVPDGDRLAARLDVLCRDERDAADMAAELNKATGLLRDFIAREHLKPNPADLSGVLASGAFTTQGKRVEGRWPIERVFVETLLNGGV